MNNMTFSETPSRTDEVNDNLFQDFPDLLSINDLRDALGIGRTTAYRLIKSEEIQYMRIGKTIKIPKCFLIDFVQKSCYNEPRSDIPAVTGG